MAEAAAKLPPIEQLYNPNSQEYMNDPVPQCLALAKRGRWSGTNPGRPGS